MSNPISDDKLTLEIANIVVQADYRDLTPDFILSAKHGILDWFGVLIAGFDEPLAKILRDQFASDGDASIIGSSLTAAPHDAALVNGATSHALDYDDVNRVGHPTAPILPSVLALAEPIGASGKDILLAYIAGYESATMFAELVAAKHYKRGFHSTGTIGAIGAGAAAAKVLGLNHAQTAEVIGLAATQASGLKLMFGTMAKPFHAGKAASNGVMAAQLVARGLRARDDGLEGAQGFIYTQVDEDVPEQISGMADMLADYRFGQFIRGNLYKYHASCYLTHSGMEAVREIIHDSDIIPDRIEKITYHVSEDHLNVCNILSPTTGLETKFSMRHTAALSALSYPTAAIETYSDKNAMNANLIKMRERVEIIASGAGGTSTRVEVKLVDGQIFETFVDVGVPKENLSEQEHALSEKFRALNKNRLGQGVQKLVDGILSIDEMGSLSEIYELCT